MFYQPTRYHILIESRILHKHSRENLKSRKTDSKHVFLLGFSEDNEKKGKPSAKILLKISVIYAFFISKTF
jgi:hypothetical protein